MGQHKEIPRTAHTTARGISSYTYLDNGLSRKRCFRIQKTLLFGVLKREKPQPRMRHAHALLEGMGHLCPRYAHASSPDIPCLSPTYAHASPPPKHSSQPLHNVPICQSDTFTISHSSAYFRTKSPPSLLRQPFPAKRTHSFTFREASASGVIALFPAFFFVVSFLSYICSVPSILMRDAHI